MAKGCPFRHYGLGPNKAPLCHITEWEFNTATECMHKDDYKTCPRYKRFNRKYRR